MKKFFFFRTACALGLFFSLESFSTHPDPNAAPISEQECRLSLTRPPSQLESPFLREFATEMEKARLQFTRRTLAVTVQHLLGNTYEFYALLSELGVSADNTFILGKAYSTAPEVSRGLTKAGNHVCPSRLPAIGHFKQAFQEDAAEMWRQVEAHLAAHPEIREVVILDDGGRVLTSVPDAIVKRYKVAGVEMTRGAHSTEKWNAIRFPIALACSSYTKKEYSSPLIIDHARSHMKETLGQFVTPGNVYGVVGAGMMGFELVQSLLALNVKVLVYDINPPEHFTKLYRHLLVPSLHDLYDRSDVIFGVTGKDHVDGKLDELRLSTKSKKRLRHLISLSSEDREFGSFLRLPTAKRLGQNLHDPIQIDDERFGSVQVLNGGYPANFHPDNHTGIPLGHMDIHFAMAMVGAYQALEVAREQNHLEDPNLLRLGISVSQQEVWSRVWLKTLSPRAFALIEGYARAPKYQDISDTTLGFQAPSRIDALRAPFTPGEL